MPAYLHRCRDHTTWCNRNGTFIRVLVVADPNNPPFHCAENIDINVQRLVVLSACNADQLNEHTSKLQTAATNQGISLVSADGYHRIIIDRIAQANRTTNNASAANQ
jgi:folate-dependent phosphoribosylglycinamide formyltransferase PurN